MNIKKIVYYLVLSFCLLTASSQSQVFRQVIEKDTVEFDNSLKKVNTKVGSISLRTTKPIPIMVLLIAVKDHPLINNSLPMIQNHADYPNELYPLLGTMPDGTLIREYVKESSPGPIPVDQFYKEMIEEYFQFNSNGKFEVEMIFPKPDEFTVYQTKTGYDEFVSINKGSHFGMVMRYSNWRKMAEEVMVDVDEDYPQIFKRIKLINIVYLVTREEYTRSEWTAYSFDSPSTFNMPGTSTTIYIGYAITLYNLNSLLHEILHRIGTAADSPNGFEGLPDRSTEVVFDAPNNMTWGHDIMYNKGQFPSENALYGTIPMLTTDRIFFEWIEPQEVIELNDEDYEHILLKDVNLPVEENEMDSVYRAAKIMIHENFKNDLDEYFLIEFRNGSGFDRNFYNVYENFSHTGLLIWHVKERVNLINRTRLDDHYYDLEVAVPYNGWLGNPIPLDEFPRDYNRPQSWYSTINAAGDFDYLDDDSSPPHLPDGGVHRWEFSDTTKEQWRPFYLRRNSLQTNFFSDVEVRGSQRNRFGNDTRPSSKDWAGNKTDILIFNIAHEGNYMTFDVSFNDGVMDVNNQTSMPYVLQLKQNFPNPFNPETTIEYSLPVKSHVALKVYDMLGRVVNTLVNNEQAAGLHKVVFNSENIASGIYFYSIETPLKVITKKMIVVK